MQSIVTTPLPLVVQLGFAGARRLYPSGLYPQIDDSAFAADLEQQLTGILQQLPAELGLGQQHFLGGISQLAVGADTAFTLACQTLQIPQRLFLPQPIDVYLSAVSKSGTPDFTADQRSDAEELLKSAHIVQQRVVSDAATRTERFNECNLELLRVSSLLLCLVCENQESKPGGTQELIALANKRRIPVLELTLSVVDGRPGLQRRWHDKENFQPPVMPVLLDHIPLTTSGTALPGIADYCAAINAVVNTGANTLRKHFERNARLVILAHVAATALSLLAFNRTSSWVPVLLIAELLLLSGGFALHRHLHKAQAVKRWALFRLVAEIIRSVTALQNFHYYLEPQFNLLQQLPELRHLLRTLNVLHLRSTRDKAPSDFARYRDAYLQNRMAGTGGNNQILYHANKQAATHRAHSIAHGLFVGSSALTIAAIIAELLLGGPLHAIDPDHLLGWPLGFISVLLPVIAVAALSLAAASDWEATHYESTDLHAFLQRKKTDLENAGSAHECKRIVLEIENRLLGKELTWFSRRSFLGVS